MTLTKQQRKKLAGEHKALYIKVSNTWVCQHDRLLWPCTTAKLLYVLQQRERGVNYANGKNKSA